MKNSKIFIVILPLVVIILLLFVTCSSGNRSKGANQNMTVINYSDSAEDTIHGTHILTDGCEDAKKTKLHLLEEAISATFDGEFGEAGKKLTFLNILSTNDCQYMTSLNDAEVKRHSPRPSVTELLATEQIPNNDSPYHTNSDENIVNQNPTLENHLDNFPLASKTWGDFLNPSQTIPATGYTAYYINRDNPKKVIDKRQVAVIA